MFNLGILELILLGAIALIFIGPKQLPGVARAVARLLNELKNVSGDLKESLMEVKEEVEQSRKETAESLRSSIGYEEIKQEFDDIAQNTTDPSSGKASTQSIVSADDDERPPK